MSDLNTNTQAIKSPYLLMWIAAIATVLFSVAGIAAIMGWIPALMGHPGDNTGLTIPGKLSTVEARPVVAKTQPAPSRAAKNAPTPATCADCGVIEFTRVTIRKDEGSGVGAAGAAVAGNAGEKRLKSSESYDITVRLDDGSSRVINEGDPP